MGEKTPDEKLPKEERAVSFEIQINKKYIFLFLFKMVNFRIKYDTYFSHKICNFQNVSNCKLKFLAIRKK